METSTSWLDKTNNHEEISPREGPGAREPLFLYLLNIVRVPCCGRLLCSFRPVCQSIVASLFIYFFIFLSFVRRSSHCGPQWLGTHFVGQGGLELTEFCLLLPLLLGLKAGAVKPGSIV